MDQLLKDFKAIAVIPEKEVKALTKKGAGLIMQSAKRKSHSKSVARAYGFITKNDSKYPLTTLIGIIDGVVGNKTITYSALASIQEFGAAERSPRKGDSKKVLIKGKWVTMSLNNPFARIPVRPFVRPAIDENKDKVTEILLNGLSEIVYKQAKKKI